MTQIQNDHQKITVKGHGSEQCFGDSFHRKTAVVLHCGRHTIGTAQADHCISRIKQAGGNHSHGTQEALHKGHGKIADIIINENPKKVEDIEY